MINLKKLNLVAAVVAVALTATVATSLHQSPSAAAEVWEQLLDSQLQDEKKCVLAGTLFVRKMPTGAGVVLSGRARCFDGREFDFSQSKPHMKFEIKACDPVVCSTAPESNQAQRQPCGLLLLQSLDVPSDIENDSFGPNRITFGNEDLAPSHHARWFMFHDAATITDGVCDFAKRENAAVALRNLREVSGALLHGVCIC